ncbi:MAG TPA: hypothetical protein VKU00_10655 [Chthonomonadaceae bacterium]|nr:hypothetical protein [Chthonomonadaceae bacterium]
MPTKQYSGRVISLIEHLARLDGAYVNLESLSIGHGEAILRITKPPLPTVKITSIATQYIDMLINMHQVRFRIATEIDISVLERRIPSVIIETSSEHTMASRGGLTAQDVLVMEAQEGTFYIWTAMLGIADIT